MTIIGNNITISLKDGKDIVKDFNFVLNDNDKLALIGEEGNGKSSLIKFIYDNSLIDEYCFYSGSVNISKEEIGYIPQSINSYYLDKTVEEYFLTDDGSFEINYEIYNKIYEIEKLLDKFKLDKNILINNIKVSSLSGGEKIKIQLIKILINKPRLYLFDEPTNDLDIETLEFLTHFMNDIKEPLIFISHDETLLSSVSNMILHLEQIKRKSEMKFTFEKMNYDDYLSFRKRKLNQQNLDAYRTHKEKEEKRQILIKQHSQVAFDLNQAVRDPSSGRILAKKMANIKSQEKKLEKMEVVEYASVEEDINLFFSDYELIPNGKVILDFHLDRLVIGNKELSKDISLFVKGPEKIALIGSNGSGKTTLIKLIIDELKNVSNVNVGYMPQNYEDNMDFELTCVEFLAKKLGYDSKTKSRIMSCLGALNFIDYEMNSPIKELSGGQKAKLYLLSLVLEEKNVLVLDEPTRNLSPLSLPTIITILKEFKGCIISISHDRRYIKEVSSKIYKLTKAGLIKM